MSEQNMASWNLLRTPPPSALKEIKGGRLKGFTDISPQWRYEVLTQVYGPCGKGWRFEIDRLWTEPAPKSQVFAFAEVSVYVWGENEWSAAIPGVGGSMLITDEKSGLHASDEAFKMAVTDALGTAMKLLGVGADVYMGKYDGSKYAKPSTPSAQPAPSGTPAPVGHLVSDKQAARFWTLCDVVGKRSRAEGEAKLKEAGFASAKDITKDKYKALCEWAEAGAAKPAEATADNMKLLWTKAQDYVRQDYPDATDGSIKEWLLKVAANTGHKSLVGKPSAQWPALECEALMEVLLDKRVNSTTGALVDDPDADGDDDTPF